MTEAYKYLYPEGFDLSHNGLSVLASHSALEIDAYLTNDEVKIASGCASRLAIILKQEAIKLDASENFLHKEYSEIKCLTETLYSLEDYEKEKGRKSVYVIDRVFEKLFNQEYDERVKHLTPADMKNEILPVIYRIAENLNSFKEFPRERQEILRDFAMILGEETVKYKRVGFKRLENSLCNDKLAVIL